MDLRPPPPQPLPPPRAALSGVVAPSTPRCRRCGHGLAPDDLCCELCGELIAKAAPGDTRRAAAADAAPARPSLEPDAGDASASAGWRTLLLGLALAPVLTFTPLLRYVGWFASSLFHESGHAAIGWALGCPSIPAISIGGHAAAVHGEQQALLCVGWMALLGWLAWRSRASRPRLALWIAALAAYPLLAFTEARDGAFLAGGHLGELAVATTFLVQAFTGGVTGNGAERAAHAMLGWYLVGRNVSLAWGLASSGEAREAYASNGSFGLENDYIRLARDVLGVSVPTLAKVMLAAALAVPIVAIAVGRRAARVASPAQPTG